jgi:hypothetical protein
MAAPAVYQEAKALDDQYAARRVHVYYCDQVYKDANDAFDRYLAAYGCSTPRVINV